MNRVGIGYDVHRFEANRRLILGGVEIAHSMGLEGHSDADVLSHAIADALLGAVGERDIGHHFPNDDETLRGMSSLAILEKTASILAEKKARIVNIDATVIAETPKLAPHIGAMRVNYSRALGIAADCVGIKATTNELLGFVGRGEGIAAIAVASIEID